MRLKRLLNLFILMIFLFHNLITAHQVEAKTIEKKRSLYQNIYVSDEKGMLCLRFKIRNRNDLNQSCIYKRNPQELVFNYYKQALAATFFLDNPKEILIIGLGGGILPNAFGTIYPNAHITSVEIDDVVVDMARKHFNYDDSGVKKTTHIKDGRVFVKRALKKKKRYDLILLDAFTGDYIPEHMMTQEYLQEVKRLSARNGLIVANTFSTSDLFDHESATYHKVFGELYQVTLKEIKTNRVIIVSNDKLPGKKKLLEKALSMREKLLPYSVDSFNIYELISSDINWDTNAKILTDQFSPANLLKGR